MQPAGEKSLLDITIDSKVYRGANGETVAAVRNFSLQLAPRSFTALLGPSGCGKTTILRIISGLDPAYEGQVTWHAPPRIGFVFQEPSLLPWRTVRQNIELTKAEAFGQAELDALTERLGLSELMNRFPGELSLGLARRVALARAFASSPSVLLLDEPFASLDEGTATRLRALLHDVWVSQPVTALLVTHNLREAIELSDRLVLMAPRPTRVLADLPVRLAHGSRTEAKIEALRAELIAEYPEFFALSGQEAPSAQADDRAARLEG